MWLKKTILRDFARLKGKKFIKNGQSRVSIKEQIYRALRTGNDPPEAGNETVPFHDRRT